MSKWDAQIAQDADFFASMVHLIPQSYYAKQQDTDNKFTHSKEKANVAAPRQSIKETSKQGVKAKAKFDPKNYTSVLSNGKSVKAESSDDEMEDDSEDDEDDDDAEDDDDDAAMVATSKSKGKSAAPAAAASKKAASSAASAAAASPSLSAISTPAIALPAASPLTSLPTPSLSSLSADVGMDQLRQRLHERIHGLSNKRKPEDHPFAKKRQKKPEGKDKKKREKNEERPSSHKNSKPVFTRDAAEEAPAAKKAKITAAPAGASASASASSLSSRPSVSAADIADSNDFEFASLKAPELGSAAAKLGGSGGGSYSLAGKVQRKKHKSDETLLKEVESFESKLGEMKSAGQGEAARALESERAIQNAILRASGVKVKDDKKLLKASLKRSEKKKEKSRTEWSERTSAAKTTQDAFHADKIARASKKQKGDRSRYVAGGAEGKDGGDKGGDKGDKKGGRAGFEGKSKKKFLN